KSAQLTSNDTTYNGSIFASADNYYNPDVKFNIFNSRQVRNEAADIYINSIGSEGNLSTYSTSCDSLSPNNVSQYTAPPTGSNVISSQEGLYRIAFYDTLNFEGLTRTSDWNSIEREEYSAGSFAITYV
ncbi:hypothetical protein, partial [Bacillus wiedmannii]|uniref:hypothetical protein n=1 Tax=Bacillus wiedmannii TaxID=1890302 RepID=UPI001484D564